MADRSNNERGRNINHYDRDFRGNSQEYRGFQNRNRNFRDRSRDVPRDPPYIAFVGNLPKGLVQGDVIKIFHDFEVKSVRLVNDRDTDEFKGYGYVEFTTPDQLKQAVSRNGRIKVDNLSAPLRIDIADHRRHGSSGASPGPTPSTSGGGGTNQRRNFLCDSSGAHSQGYQGQFSRKSGRQIGNRWSIPNLQGSYRGGRGGGGGGGGGHNDDFQNIKGSNSSDFSFRDSMDPHVSSTSFQSSRSFPNYPNSNGTGNSYNKINRYSDRNGHSNNNNNFSQSSSNRRGIAPRLRSVSSDREHYSNFGQNRSRDRRGHYNPNEQCKQSHSETVNPPSCSLDDDDRPKIVLKPRTITEPINALAETKQAASIFGNAKPRKSQPEDELDD